MPINKNNENPRLLKCSSFLLFIFRNAYSLLSLNWIDRYVEQTAHTDFADGAKNIRTKNMIKHANSITLLQLLQHLHCVKSVRIRSYSGLHFPAFRLNTERYSLSSRIQSGCGKIRTRIPPNKDTFEQCSIY